MRGSGWLSARGAMEERIGIRNTAEGCIKTTGPEWSVIEVRCEPTGPRPKQGEDASRAGRSSAMSPRLVSKNSQIGGKFVPIVAQTEAVNRHRRARKARSGQGEDRQRG